MSNKKKFVASMVAITLLVLLVQVQLFSKGATESNDQKPITIRATMWIGEEASIEALNKLTALYEERNPGVKVQWINIAGGGPFGRDKLFTMIAGGDGPDLMQLNTGQFEGLAARGALLPLDDYVKQEALDVSVFYPQSITGCMYDGTLYGLPIDISNHILYYNKDLFDSAGLSYPSDDWTWDDLLYAAQKLTIDKTGNGKIDQWGFGVNNTVWAWAGFVHANSGEVLNSDRTRSMLNSPQAIEALQFFFDLQTKYEVSPPPGALPEQGWAGDWMLTGSTAMGIFGPWWRPAMVGNERAFRWDVALPPKSPTTGERGSVMYTDQWAIGSKSKYPQQTWDFMKFLASAEGQELWAKFGGSRSISPVIDVSMSEDWLNYGGSSGQIILDTISFSTTPPVDFAKANEVENIWNQEFGLVFAGQSTVTEAVKKIDALVNEILQE